jgi:hypothetical protein
MEYFLIMGLISALNIGSSMLVADHLDSARAKDKETLVEVISCSGSASDSEREKCKSDGKSDNR